MTEPVSTFDEAAFHAAQRRRLSSARHMPPFAGPWADALMLELQRLLPDQLRFPVDQQAVVDCFADVPAERADRLFHAVTRACKATAQMDQGATTWATELTVYAAMRCIALDVWTGLRHWQGDGASAHAAVDHVPTSSSLIAAIGLAGLQGRVIRLGHQPGPRGVIDLSEATLTTDVGQALLARLYDQMLRNDALPRLNPDAPLSPDEIGALRARFDEYRLDGEYTAPYVHLPHLDEASREEVAQGIARLLNTAVIHGAAGHDDRLVNATTQITVASLKAKVEQVFRLLRHFVPSEAAPSRVAPAPAAPAVPAAVPDAPVVSASRPAYTWDVFVSHASEDKTGFVDKLVAGLQAVGLRVWYDSIDMDVGDSLVGKIDQGLRESRFCVVVLSKDFLAKGWPQGEFQAWLSHELSDGRKRVLPILFGLTIDEVRSRSPLLASKLAVSADKGLPAVIAALLNAVQRAS